MRKALKTLAFSSFSGFSRPSLCARGMQVRGLLQRGAAGFVLNGYGVTAFKGWRRRFGGVSTE